MKTCLHIVGILISLFCVFYLGILHGQARAIRVYRCAALQHGYTYFDNVTEETVDEILVVNPDHPGFPQLRVIERRKVEAVPTEDIFQLSPFPPEAEEPESVRKKREEHIPSPTYPDRVTI